MPVNKSWHDYNESSSHRIPACMINAFKSTLEESLADLILLLIDCSARKTFDNREKRNTHHTRSADNTTKKLY
jgi:50S ribosomal subunit-associated GTPase HflX